MGLEAINDEKINELIKLPKKVTNSNIREKTKGKHTERNYTVVDIATEDLSFNIFLRQNLQIENDFSCGLLWNMTSGESIILVRYNGSSHAHPNHIEGDRLGYECHIHKASEKYILAGKRPEGYATASNPNTRLCKARYILC